jgi:hypothetical protein
LEPDEDFALVSDPKEKATSVASDLRSALEL